MTHGFIGRQALVLLAAGGLALVAIACASHSAHTGSTAAAAGLPPFDSGASWNDFQAQMALGPRPVGTPAHEKLKDYLNTELRKSTPDVLLQQWTDPTVNLPLTNLIARFPGKGSGAVLLAAHWDTRPTADYDPNPANRSKPIPGADDGASETAVLLELARVLKQNPPPVTVWLVFFDGEDYSLAPGDYAHMFLGSKYFAKNQPADTPRKGVLLDMIGPADLSVPKEQTSVQRAPAVVNEVWAAARRAGHATEFPDQTGDSILDDHVPLLDAGIACIDLIDFSYAPWHTLADTTDKCSAHSLGVIGDTMVAWIYGQKQ
jgi:Zn-dependent M28 family amino/carboxypeptidase